jgi:hypothetical protein
MLKGTAVSKHRYQNAISRVLVGGAIALVVAFWGAAPAGADTNAGGAGPSPFSTLHCGCRETAPAGSQVRADEIDRGIRQGLAAQLPGLPGPTQPPQSRP